MSILSRYSYRQIWFIVYPILISLLMEQLIGMTDTAFLGRVGEVELGASALAGVYYMAIFMLAFGFSIGAQIMIARRNGERHYKQIGPIFYQGLYFLLLLAVVMFFASRYFTPMLLEGVIGSRAVYDAAISYLDWRIFGFFFSFCAVMFRAFYVGTVQTKTLTLNSIVMVLSNVVFNYVLIFGKFGFPALGIAGAAIGSSLAEMVSVIYFVIYTRYRVDLVKYGMQFRLYFQPAVLRRILGISLWTMTQNFLAVGVWFLFFLSIEHMGERSLAVTNIIRSISAIPFMIVTAFASTCSSLVSNLIGARQTRYVWGTMRQCIVMAYCFVIPVLLFCVLFPDLVLGVYTDSSELMVASRMSLYVLCSAYLLSVPANVFFQSVSGTGNTRTAFIIEIVTLVVYGLYLYYLVFELGVSVAVCWSTEHVYCGMILLLSYLYLRGGGWRRKRI